MEWIESVHLRRRGSPRVRRSTRRHPAMPRRRSDLKLAIDSKKETRNPKNFLKMTKIVRPMEKGDYCSAACRLVDVPAHRSMRRFDGKADRIPEKKSQSGSGRGLSSGIDPVSPRSRARRSHRPGVSNRSLSDRMLPD